jgi:hypothetical protein
LEALFRAATTDFLPAFADERFETSRSVFVDAVETAFEDFLEAVPVRDFLTTVFARASDVVVLFFVVFFAFADRVVGFLSDVAGSGAFSPRGCNAAVVQSGAIAAAGSPSTC